MNSAEITGLAGANGSGKTTLIRILLGQLVDFKGTYSINKKTISDVTGSVCAKYAIGYSPDTPILDEVLTPHEIASMVALMHETPKNVFDSDIAFFKETLDIGDWWHRKTCQQLSHGMRKKVSIALAYLANPAFVILDEPVNGLDPVAVAGLRRLVVAKKNSGIGALVVSHILDFIEKCADTVVLLCYSKLIFSGSLSLLKSEHPSKATLEEIYLSLFGLQSQIEPPVH